MSGKLVSDLVVQQMSQAYKASRARKPVKIQQVINAHAQAIIYCVLTEDLAAPTSLYGTPTSAIAQRLSREGDIGTQLTRMGGVPSSHETDYVRVWNHDPNLTKSTGDPIKCGWILGELMVLDAGSGSGSGPAMVEFALEEVCCDTLTATATVTRILCSGGSGVELGDLIELIDSRQCHLIGANPEPSMWLGIKGVAIKMEFNISDYPAYSYVCDDLAPITGNNDCKWSILDLCNNGNFCA